MARRTKLREKERSQQRILVWGFPARIAVLLIPGFDQRVGWSEPSATAVIAAMAIAFGAPEPGAIRCRPPGVPSPSTISSNACLAFSTHARAPDAALLWD
ncbi:MAG: hypothetical protein MUF54_09310 [Polyangiaceae bacterium]|jgi:hypothetical protein|nr:hypothetical protein [Polyangiaceae bacterium]